MGRLGVVGFTVGFAAAGTHRVVLRSGGCACTSVSSYTSGGVDVRPHVGCADFSSDGYFYCYTVGSCLGASPSTLYAGARYRTCTPSPPPPPAINACDDPAFAEQWHLPRVRGPEAWSLTRGDANVSIVVVDDGLQYSHPDLAVDRTRSFGWNVHTGERRDTADSPTSVHGTAVAGIAAAVAHNGVGGCGLASHATLVGVRIIEEEMMVDQSFEDTLSSFAADAVLCNSWGPPDDGRVAGPGVDASYASTDVAMSDFHSHARAGRGGLLVFAAGNGGPHDNVNDDGFASHPSTLAVGSVGDDEQRTSYSEPGACIDVVAPSAGGLAGITTTDVTTGGYAPGNLTDSFGGTSAAAPIVAAVVALLLSHRSDLSAEDVRTILATTARRIDVDDASWVQNAAGVYFSPWYGFGMVDARAALDAATTWVSLPERGSACADEWFGELALTAVTDVPLPVLSQPVATIQRVGVFVDVAHPYRGDLSVSLVSPHGTESVLTYTLPQTLVLHDAEFVAHTFYSNAFFGESSETTGWRLRLQDRTARGVLHRARVCFTGTGHNVSHAPPVPPPAPSPTSNAAWVWVGVGASVASVGALAYAAVRAA